MLLEEIRNTDCAFFDSHAHYYDERFRGKKNPHGVDALLDALFEQGILGIINVGTSYSSALEVIEKAKQYEKMYAAVGVHPSDLDSDGMSYVEQIAKIRELAKNREENKIIAIGEAGLDYYWTQDTKAEQKDCFERQLALAEELSMPIIIHDREAHGDCFETVLRYPNVKGVFHCYSGSAEMAKELIKRGWYISFSGVISYDNAEKIKGVAAIVPDDKILIETDAPYLTPQPYKNKLNHSGRLFYTASALARERGVDVRTISDITYRNARELFKID